MSSKTRKVTLIYGEETVPMKNRRIPKSKSKEIEGKIEKLLSEYHAPKVVEVVVGKLNESVSEIDEVKLNEVGPADNETAFQETVELSHFVKRDEKVKKNDLPASEGNEPWRKRFNEQQSDPKYSNSKKAIPKPDPTIIANLKNIAEGKTVPLDQLFNFEIVSSLPDKDDRIFLDKKGNVMFDKYNPSIFYVAHEDKFLMFTDKGELEKFCEQQLIVLI